VIRLRSEGATSSEGEVPFSDVLKRLSSLSLILFGTTVVESLVLVRRGRKGQAGRRVYIENGCSRVMPLCSEPRSRCKSNPLMDRGEDELKVAQLQPAALELLDRGGGQKLNPVGADFWMCPTSVQIDRSNARYKKLGRPA
jgi:hypothetical protein